MAGGLITLSTAVFGLLLGIFNWALPAKWPHVYTKNQDLRRLHAERLLSVAHSASTVMLASYGLALGWPQTPDSTRSVSPAGFQYDAPNSVALELSLCLTQGYFIVDSGALWYNAVAEGKQRWPITFTVHHVACFGYLALCLWIGVGAQTAAVAIVMGEVTNPLQNVWFISKDVPALESVYLVISPIFTYFFIVCRCFIGPVLSADVVYFCVGLPNSFGLVVGSVFSVLCIGVNIGGLMWSRGLWQGYRKFRAKNANKNQ